MMVRRLYDETHELFRSAFRTFVAREIVPHVDRWERAGIVDKAMFREAGRAGFLGLTVPAEFGGGGATGFRFNAVIAEELNRAGVGASGACLMLHNDVCVPYFLSGDDDQKRRWLPGVCTGEFMAAIAMTEPGTGSDLASLRTTARRNGDHYVVNGAKTFISNGLNSDLVIVACTTDPAAGHRGITLLVVESGTQGFERGRKLEKIGLHAQDTAELFFRDARVPVSNRLGVEESGFRQLLTKLPQERLSIAVMAVANAQAAFGWTLDYCKERHAFGQPIGSFQHQPLRSRRDAD